VLRLFLEFELIYLFTPPTSDLSLLHSHPPPTRLGDSGSTQVSLVVGGGSCSMLLNAKLQGVVHTPPPVSAAYGRHIGGQERAG